jgi:hypothetical protein
MHPSGYLNLLAVFALSLAACNSGTSSGGPPFIGASLASFAPGAAPAGYQSASVVVGDVSTGEVITNASVTLNGVSLAYAASTQSYQADVPVAPGASISLDVRVGGSTYTATARQFTTYPSVSTPESGSVWPMQCAGTVSWSPGTPMAGASYGLGLLDAANPNGTLLWPGGGGSPQSVPVGTTSYTVPANTWTEGNRLLLVGLVAQEAIAGADPSSVFVVGGFTSIPLTVNNVASLVSLSFSFGALDPAVILKNTTQLFDVTGTYCDGSTQTDLRYLTRWTTSSPEVATVSNAFGEWGTVTSIGDGDTGLTVDAGSISVSTNLKVRGTLQDAGVLDNLQGVVWSGTRYVAVGSGGILTSRDGVDWTRQTSGVYPTDSFGGVTWSGTQFVAVGFDQPILTSPDGVAWTRISGAPRGSLTGVAWSGDRFVAVGQQLILTSPDGVAWSAPSIVPAPTGLNAVVWAGNKFAAAAAGAIWTSPDGMSWTRQDPGTGESLQGIAWSGTRLVAVGSAGTVLASPDGATWTAQTVPVIAGSWRAVTWTGTQFVVVGAGATILTSPDGLTWSTWLRQPDLLYSLLFSATGSGDEFVTVGYQGLVVSSF